MILRLKWFNSLDTVLADTGAAVSVCGSKHARKWDLIDGFTKSHVKIIPYKSQAIPIMGISTCGVSVGNRTVPVSWQIIADDFIHRTKLKVADWPKTSEIRDDFC